MNGIYCPLKILSALTASGTGFRTLRTTTVLLVVLINSISHQSRDSSADYPQTKHPNIRKAH